MTVLKKDPPWACSYLHNGGRYSVTICHNDPDQLFAQMSAVLDGFSIDGWAAGYVTSAADLEQGMEEAQSETAPEAYREWIECYRRKIN